MEPTLRSGDLVLVNLASTQARDGAIYVLRHDDLLVAKRLQRVTDGSLYIRGDNPGYGEEHVPAERVGELEIIGRVVWAGRKM